MLQGCRSDPLLFGRRKNPPTKIVTEISVCKLGGWKLSYETVSTTYTALYRISDNTSYSIRSALFTRVNPDRVTLCDAIRRADAFLFLDIWRIIVFSQQTENQHFLIFSKKPHIFWRWIESLWYIRCRSSTPILKKLTGSLSQDFRWRDHVNRAFLSRPHASAVQEALG